MQKGGFSKIPERVFLTPQVGGGGGLLKIPDPHMQTSASGKEVADWLMGKGQFRWLALKLKLSQKYCMKNGIGTSFAPPKNLKIRKPSCPTGQ
jgi:hypothetical protein